MFLLLKKIKRFGVRNCLKKLIILSYQQARIYFYKSISFNKPELNFTKICQPVYFMGQGKIVTNKVQFGVLTSPFFLNGYSYVEARAGNSLVEIGAHTFINNNAVIIADKASISIGEFCLIGANFTVFDSDFHGLNKDDRLNGNYEARKVVILDNVFIGNNVTITKGVTIGKNAVIGAGSVVTQDIPENTIYAGNPAKFIKRLPVTNKKNDGSCIGDTKRPVLDNIQ